MTTIPMAVIAITTVFLWMLYRSWYFAAMMVVSSFVDASVIRLRTTVVFLRVNLCCGSHTERQQ